MSILAALAASMGFGAGTAAAELRLSPQDTAAPLPPIDAGAATNGERVLRVRGTLGWRPSSTRRRRGWYAGEHGTPSRRSLRLRGRSRGARRARKAANRG